MEKSAGRRQGSVIQAQGKVFEDLDMHGSSTEGDHWLGYRTNKRPEEKL